MPPIVPVPTEVKQAFHEELHPEQQTAFISWVAFTVTFGVVRGITYCIKDGVGPLRNVSIGGVHLHHYLWGIATVSAVGGVALRGDDRLRRHPLVATAYGAGLALIVDEFALLLDLRDVYWAREGRVSVDIAMGLIAATGSLLAGLPVVRRLVRNRTSGHEAGGAGIENHSQGDGREQALRQPRRILTVALSRARPSERAGRRSGAAARPVARLRPG